MEYTFKNGRTGKLTTIVLSDFSFSVESGSKEIHVPYASILSVRLRRSGNRYFTVIKPSYYPEIRISNEVGDDMDDGKYVDFVMDLHAHLRDKSMAYYVCGNSLQQLLLITCVAVLMAFGIPHFIGDLSAFHPNLTAIGLSLLSILLIVIFNWGHFPNVYKPDRIPPQFLPAPR